MKHLIIIAFAIIWTNIYSQDSTLYQGKMYKVHRDGRLTFIEREKGDTTYMVIETLPEFPGGKNEMMSFIQKNIVFPKSAIKDNVHGKVIANFMVRENGNVDSIKIVQPVRKDLDEAVIEVIQKMPKWKAGTQNGKAVNVRYNIPVTF